MTFTSLDKIVKNLLLKRRYGLHFYLDFLISAKDCIRELNFDLPVNPIRYAVLPLNDNHAIELPDDYSDWAGVYVRRDQYLLPLIEDNSLDLVVNYDSTFAIQPYSQGVATESATQNGINQYVGGLSAYWWMVNWDSFGENLGRQFGGVGVYTDTFRENRPRNEIKINENLSIDFALLEYIGDGTDADSASKINSYAQAAVEAYCMWQFKENNRTYSEGEAQVAKRDYEQQYEILRGRLSDLSLDKFKRIVQSNTRGIKY
jgi:hypothetical protein